MFWSPPQRLRVQSNAPTLATVTPGTAITTGASASAKGTPVQIFSATDFDVFGITLVLSNYGTNGAASDAMLDLLVGPNDDVLIPNLIVGYSLPWLKGGLVFRFSLYIPAGVKVSAQVAGRRTSTSMQLQAFLTGGMLSPPWRVGSRVTAYGVTSVPTGTLVNAAQSGEGTWTEITSSTTDDHFQIVPAMQFRNRSTGAANRPVVLDYGVGSSGNEIELGTCQYMTSSDESMTALGDLRGENVSVASGSRLVTRISTDGTPTDFDCALYGVT